VLYVAAFPRWDVSILAWLALAPFLAGIHGKTTKEALGQAFWLGMGITLLGFPWVAYTLAQFGGLPLWMGILGLILFGLICQPQFWIFAPVYAWVTRRPSSLILSVVLLAFFYAGLDWILPKLFVDTLGHAFYRNTWMRQAAALGGPALLTFAALLWNLTLALVLHEWRLRSDLSPGRRLKTIALKLKKPISLASTASLALLAYGSSQYQHWHQLVAAPDKTAIPTVRAGVIQANIGDFDKVAAETGAYGAADRIIETYIKISDESLTDPERKPDVLVWPETAYPTTYRSPRTPRERRRDEVIEQFVRSRGVPLVFGGYDRMKRKDYNSLFVQDAGTLTALNPDREESTRLGSDLLVYHKNLLLLFGETMPGSELFPILDEWFPQVGNFGRGPGPEVLKVPLRNQATSGSAGALAIAPIICYEALFTRYTMEGARRGANLLLNVTNDSWFGDLGEPELHLALTTFRSIETRLPQLRSTNTGISALILPDGTLAQTSPKDAALPLNWDIPLIRPDPTLIVRLGDWFGPLAFTLGVLGLMLNGRFRRG
jgi:apolipoprotein N-acyltransferase